MGDAGEDILGPTRHPTATLLTLKGASKVTPAAPARRRGTIGQNGHLHSRARHWEREKQPVPFDCKWLLHQVAGGTRHPLTKRNQQCRMPWWPTSAVCSLEAAAQCPGPELRVSTQARGVAAPGATLFTRNETALCNMWRRLRSIWERTFRRARDTGATWCPAVCWPSQHRHDRPQARGAPAWR
jgi:hypothetical protein